MRERLCVALDVSYIDAVSILDKLYGTVGWVKIGPALLTTPFGVSLLNDAKIRWI